MKEIIKEGYILLDKPGSFPEHHKILDLWNVAKDIALKVFENDKKDIAYAEHIIKEFHKIDPDSFAFRYPTKKAKNGGEKTLEGITHINIRHLSEHVTELEKDLEGISMGISSYRDIQKEMRASPRENGKDPIMRSIRNPDPSSGTRFGDLMTTTFATIHAMLRLPASAMRNRQDAYFATAPSSGQRGRASSPDPSSHSGHKVARFKELLIDHDPWQQGWSRRELGSEAQVDLRLVA